MIELEDYNLLLTLCWFVWC